MKRTPFDKLTLGFFDITGSRGKNKRMIQLAREHYEHNKSAWRAYLDGHGIVYKKKAGGEPLQDEEGNLTVAAPYAYIEHQSVRNGVDLGGLKFGKDAGKLADKVLFGGRSLTAKENSCEVVAVYNALVSLAPDGIPKISFPELLYRFEKSGISLGGNFGTAPRELLRFMEEQGFRCVLYTGDSLRRNAQLYKELEEHYDTYILTAWNDKKHMSYGIHTVSITRSGEGYRIHNDGVSGVFPSLETAVANFNNHSGNEREENLWKGAPICIIGVGRG